MSSLVIELYDALRKAGVDDELARAAAKAVLSAEDKAQLATKADLTTLEARLIKWNVGAMAVLTAVFAAIVGLVR